MFLHELSLHKKELGYFKLRFELRLRMMVRQHGSLEKDAETNQAAWEAAKGAAWGGTKVSWYFFGGWELCEEVLFEAFVRLVGAWLCHLTNMSQSSYRLMSRRP